MASPAANPNQAIYNENYVASQLDLRASTAWDSYLVDLRMELVRRHGAGKDVVDLCCGSGSYLLPNLALFRSAVAVDFSRPMLDALRERAGNPPPPNLTILEGDAQELSLPDASADFVWSFTALYHIPDLERVLAHVARVLRPGGVAALELGNWRSLNTLVALEQHRTTGSARPYGLTYPQLRRAVRRAGLEATEWRSFQLLTMYGTPRRLRPLAPLLSARWKGPMGRVVGGRSLDEWVSGAWPLRHVAFRHLVVARKS